MTKEEILVLLKEMKQNTINGAAYDDPKRERKFIALDEAIKALEQESCEDAISRKSAVSRISDLIVLELKGERLPTWNEVHNALGELPSVQPKPIECEDAISREDALMCMTGEYIADREYKPEDIISKHIRRLRALPPVQPKYNAEEWCKDVVSERSLCDSCKNRRCIFQIGIVRKHCDYYKAESEAEDESND